MMKKTMITIVILIIIKIMITIKIMINILIQEAIILMMRVIHEVEVTVQDTRDLKVLKKKKKNIRNLLL